MKSGKRSADNDASTVAPSPVGVCRIDWALITRADVFAKCWPEPLSRGIAISGRQFTNEENDVTKKPNETAMMFIGVKKETVEAARSALLDFLNCEKAGDSAKVAAFDAFKSVCQINGGINVSHCNFQSGKK